MNAYLHEGSFGSTLGILSAMLTPAVLILASSSMIIATSNRLSRVIDRTRKLFDQHRKYAAASSEEQKAAERNALHKLLLYQMKRVRLLQRSMVSLYFALCLFVTTSVTIGIFEIAALDAAWVPVTIGMIGALFLFNSTVQLFLESRVASASVHYEMRFISTSLA